MYIPFTTSIRVYCYSRYLSLEFIINFSLRSSAAVRRSVFLFHGNFTRWTNETNSNFHVLMVVPVFDSAAFNFFLFALFQVFSVYCCCFFVVDRPFPSIPCKRDFVVVVVTVVVRDHAWTFLQKERHEEFGESDSQGGGRILSPWF